MDTALDMGNMYPEHRSMMDNFIAQLLPLFDRNVCLAAREAKYELTMADGHRERFEPDISIVCGNPQRRGMVYTATPRFVAEVLSAGTEQSDRSRKMQAYLEAGVQEYWLMDWERKRVERYTMSDDETHWDRRADVTEENAEELAIFAFQCLKVSFEKIFNVSEPR